MTASITREAALRLGMAVKELGGVSLHGFVQAVGERIGLPLTETRLATLTVTDLREIRADHIRRGLISFAGNSLVILLVVLTVEAWIRR